MKDSLPFVVIIDIDHQNGLQTARIFKDRNIKVVGIARNLNHYCAKTRVCEKIVKTDTKTEQLIETLVSLGKDFTQKPILIASQDISVLLISRHRERLEEFYRIALPQKEIVEMLMDKLSFYEYATRNQLPIAKYLLIKTKDEAEKAIENLNFPCIIKPPMKSPLWEENTIIKGYKVYDRDDFIRAYDMCSQWTDLLLAQEWIEGTDVDLYSCNCYFDKKGIPLVSFIAKKLRQYPPVTGNTSLGVECKADEVEKTSLDFFKKLKYHGLGYIEMKKDVRSGKFYIIEPNIGRPTGRSALAEAAGVEILYTMYCDILGLPLPDNIEQRYTGVKWIHIRTDLMAAYYYWRKKELTIGEWYRSIKGKKYFAIFSLKDPVPFLAEILTGVRQVFKGLFSRAN